ncbi:PDZ domain-containing protein [Myxococcota bacterium]|nr:PDZ domain-containing protein [Myxococcota bacterium]
MRKLVFAAAAALLVATAAQPAHAGLLKSGSFEVLSGDDKGGGWVINHIPALGDRLWGCADVKTVQDCKQVYFEKWTPATSLEFIHVTDSSMKGWLKLSVPVVGDYLLACEDPKGEPRCTEVELELRPPLAGIDRVWPDYDCDKGCSQPAPGASAGGGGGLPIPGLGKGGGGAKPNVVQAARQGDMWMQASLKLPGPVNLYACRNLESKPECRLALPDFLIIDREALGLKKLEEIEHETSDGTEYGPGVRIVEVEPDSAAEKSKLRGGDVIKSVGGFPVNRIKHLDALLAQYPATYTIPIELDNGDRVKLKVFRKRPKQK